MKLNQIFLLFFLLLIGQEVFGAQIRGVVRDETGERLPFVSVYVEHTTHGAASNLNGEYIIEVEAGEHVLIFQLIGYEKKRVKLTVKGVVEQDVVLVSEGVQLEELTVQASKKDKAHELMKKVIAAKEKYKGKPESYTCNMYVKAALDKETKELWKLEDSKDSLSSSEDGESKKTKERQRLNFLEHYGLLSVSNGRAKEERLASHDFTEKSNSTVSISVQGDDDRAPTVQNNPYLFFTSHADAEFDFYQNLIQVPSLSEKPFISPLSTGAFLSYKFKLEEAFYVDGKLVYKIQVLPRLKQGNLFRGILYVEDESWALKSVDLEMNSGALRFFKAFKVIQEYKEVEPEIWCIQNQTFFYHTKEIGQLMIGQTSVAYWNYKLNPTFEKRFFSQELRSTADDAYDKDLGYWDSIRPLTLRSEERVFVLKQDSVKTHWESEAYKAEQDSIYNRLTIWDFLFNGIGYRNTFLGNEWYINPQIASVQPFGIGGYRHAFGGHYHKTFSKATRLELEGQVDFGFTNKDLKGSGKLAYLYQPKRFGKFYIKGGDTYDMINDFESLAATFSRSNYVRHIHYGIGHSMELVNGVYLDLSTEYSDQKSIEDLTLASWSGSLFGELNTPQTFERYQKAVVTAHLKLRFAQRYATEPNRKVVLGTPYPKVDVLYKKGIPDILNSDVNFDFLEIQVFDDVKVGTMGTSKYQVFMGKFLNAKSMRFIDHKFFRGSDRFFYSNPLKSFQLLGPTLHTPQAYLQAHYVHHFHGALMNKIPLINRLKLHSVVGAGTLLIQEHNFNHAEAYAGLERAFKIRGQLMKIGVYYVAADSNHSNLAGTLKFGFDFFDSFTNSWSY